MDDDSRLSRSEARGLRTARELEGHVSWLDSFTGAALGVLAVASGIYTYLGVSSLLDDTGALSFFAAMAYSVAVSVGIFVFWSYLMRLLPAVRTAGARIGLFLSMLLGSAAIIAMSSWLNAAALAGAAAVEQHMASTVQRYQSALEQANSIAVASQGLERDVARVRQSFVDLSEQEATGQLSGFAGEGAVFRLLRQKSDELAALEAQIASQQPLVDEAFAEGNAILSRMRALTVEPGAVDPRSVLFSEEAVRLANVITRLRQLSVAPLVVRAANDLARSVVVPELDGATATTRQSQSATMDSVLTVLGQRAETLRLAAEAVLTMPAPADTTYTQISTADAVILYAGNFVPSWAGAIAIDLLPAVLVMILAITQGAIRSGRERAATEDLMTLSELRAAVRAMREVGALDAAPPAPPPVADAPEPGREPEAKPRPLSAVETGRPAE
ncbi:hypothetical protein OG2516_01726 [Oceanicola granulosus HTCC2516]|uniref:DUF4407 domain-containing protein n=1 Tax=Oceanicola granulosus (strain ATCC BAA-861 / DSM 15982 / KCTC 12143 / HTCC2516) TaxID=314256 RepID=Q2CFU4_OCEGH|nr:hypothetical protein [Oceanicola granulosus]EAR51598.1 hypothetical protein OG2516_01726 [Oceanicola granulosus HTCC2516]